MHPPMRFALILHLLLVLFAPRMWTSVDGNPTGKAAHPNPSALLAGRVIDSSGLPLHGVQVLALEEGVEDPPRPLEAPIQRARTPLAATTNPDGRFELAGLRPGPLRITLRMPGFATRDVEGLRLAAHGRTDTGTFTLSTARLVSGRVVDAHGDAVRNAWIAALAPERSGGNESYRVARPLDQTDASGSFVTDVLDDGAWTLVVRPDHGPATSFPSAVPHGRSDRHVDLTLPAVGTIAGVVVTRPDGLFDKVDVYALPLSVTDAAPDVPATELRGGETGARVAQDGSFELSGLRADEVYSLIALPAGVPRRRVDLWSEPKLVPSGAVGIKLELSHSARLRFRTLDGRTGDALTLFDVRLFGAFASRARAEDGTLREERDHPWIHHPKGLVALDGLRPEHDEPVTLVVTAAGYAPAERTLELAPGATLELGDIRLTPKPVLEVRVTSATTGEPVRDARLSILVLTDDGAETETATLAFTDEHGIGRVEDRPGRARLLGVRARGLAPVVLTSPFPTAQDVADETSEHVVVALEPGAVARVRVTGPGGATLLAAPVVHEVDDKHLALFGWARNTPELTATDGVAHFSGLAPGVHRFTSGRTASPAPHEWAVARLGQRDTVELSIGSTRLALLEGYVTESGEPLAGAVLTLTAAEGAVDVNGERRPSSRTTRTNERGAFELRGLTPGEYLVEWTHPARAMAWRTRIGLDPGRSELLFALPLTVLTGTVRDEQGRPVVGALLALANEHEHDIFDRGPTAPPFTRSDVNGDFLLRGVDPDLSLGLVAHDPRTHSSARVRIEPLRADGLVGDVELVLVRGAELRVAPDPPGLSGPHALIATHEIDHEDDDAPPASSRAVVPYTGGEAVFGDLAPGTWTLTVAALDGFGRVRETWELATVELAAGEPHELVPGN